MRPTPPPSGTVQITAARPPVGGDDGLDVSDVPALLQVVVDEPLQQQLVDRRTATGTGNRPYVVGQCTDDPVTWGGRTTTLDPR